MYMDIPSSVSPRSHDVGVGVGRYIHTYVYMNQIECKPSLPSSGGLCFLVPEKEKPQADRSTPPGFRGDVYVCISGLVEDYSRETDKNHGKSPYSIIVFFYLVKIF